MAEPSKGTSEAAKPVEDAKEPPNVNMQDDMKQFRAKHYFRLLVATAGFVVLAWMFGRLGCGIFWLAPFLVVMFSWWNRTSTEILETTVRLADIEAHRQRAFKNAETAEWLNFIVNRWCVFSDSSILSLIKTSLDPLLEYYKPNFIDAIEVEDFTLGNRTPYFKYIECFDSFEDNKKLKASEIGMRFPPQELTRTPKYKAVMDVDLGLSSPDSKFVIRVKLAKAGMLDLSTDIAVEEFHIHGKMQLVFSFNRNIPFPHLAAISLCFLEEPEVSFNVRLLKAVQLMEFPLLKNWVANLVNDCLKLSLVDPGRLTIPLCDDPEVLGHGAQYACGVLTLKIEGGSDGKPTDDTHWCALSLGEQKRQLKEVNHGDEWVDQVSVLVYSLIYDKLVIKIKAKRMLGNKYTVLEYQLPLARLGLDTNGTQEQIFEKSRERGTKLKVSFEYSSLQVLNITNETTEENFKKNYLEKTKEEDKENTEVAGVVCVCIHSAHNLLPMDKNGLSDPYCIVYENRREVKSTTCVENTLDPVWDNVIEFCTADYTKTVITLVLHDKDVTALETLRIKDDPDDFMGSCNFSLKKDQPYFFKKKMDVLYRISQGKDGIKKAGTIIVSALFRPVPAVAKTEKVRTVGGLPDGEPLEKKSKKKPDAQALEALLIAEKGGVEIQIIQGRNLVVMDITGKSDPFVTIRIGSGKENFRGKVIYNTLSPVWNETCKVPLPKDDEKMIIDVWDKDPLSQEKMGHLVFTLAQLKEKGKDPDAKEWYKLKKVKTGEIQLAFTYIAPQSSQNVDAIGDGVAEDSEQAPILNENAMNNNNNNSPAVPLSNNHKFHGVSGEVGDVKNLPELDNPAQIYFKARFDSNKDGKKSRASSVLFKTAYYPYSTRQHIGVPFQHKSGISSHMYLILEAKGKGKTDTIDHVSISFGELFAGNKYVSRWLQMDNGGCIHVTLTCEEIENIVESSGRTNRSRLSIRRNKSVEQNV